MKKLTVLIIVYLFCSHCIAQRLRITGSWTATVTTITEAGNDYASSTLQSATNQTEIDVRVPNTPGLNHYTINIKRADSGSNWNTAGLQLWAKRTGNGTGGGTGSSVVGGTAYQQITTSDLYFFDGYNDNNTYRNNIPVQYQITGISVTVPVANYSTSITYTVIDN
jgi:hypothetical protein